MQSQKDASTKWEHVFTETINWKDGDMKVSFFFLLKIKTLFFVGYPAILVLEDATSALELPHTNVGLPYTDFKHLFNQYIFSTWQND